MHLAAVHELSPPRRETRVVLLTCGLAEIVVTDAVNENHQHRPCDKEKHHRGQRINKDADPEPGSACR